MAIGKFTAECGGSKPLGRRRRGGFAAASGRAKSAHHRRDTAMLELASRLIVASRYLLVVFLVGLCAGLALYAVRFVLKLGKLATELTTMAEDDFLIAILHLVDSTLIASLVVIVAVSSFDSLVARLHADGDRDDIGWAGKTDYGNLKLKVATAIVAISSIHLLQVFMKLEQYTEANVYLRTAVHMVFVVAAVLLAVLDRLERGGKLKA